MGTCSCSSVRSAAVASKPFMTGMSKSISTRSNSGVRAGSLVWPLAHAAEKRFARGILGHVVIGVLGKVVLEQPPVPQVLFDSGAAKNFG